VEVAYVPMAGGPSRTQWRTRADDKERLCQHISSANLGRACVLVDMPDILHRIARLECKPIFRSRGCKLSAAGDALTEMGIKLLTTNDYNLPHVFFEENKRN
jgi:hypothetical protein